MQSQPLGKEEIPTRRPTVGPKDAWGGGLGEAEAAREEGSLSAGRPGLQTHSTACSGPRPAQGHLF